MNTKVLHRLSMLMAFIIVIPLMIFAISASIKASNKPEENNPAIEQPLNPDNNNNNNNNNNNEKEEEKTYTKIVEGIYYFQANASYSDIHYLKNDKEVFKYFKTNDRNGVNRALNSLGINEFIKGLTVENGEKKYIEFSSNNKVSSYTMIDDEYLLLNENEFEYKFEDSKFISTGINPVIETDKTGKIVTLYYPFYYEKDDGTIEITPISVKVVLKFKTSTFESVALNNSFEYKYVSNSCKLSYKFDNTINSTDVLNKVKDLFDLNDSTNVLLDVENLISNYKFIFNHNFSNLTLEDVSDDLRFSYHTIQNLTFTAFNNVKIKIENKSFGTNSTPQLELSVYVDDYTTLEFIIESNIEK